jgi:hypothetical protein
MRAKPVRRRNVLRIWAATIALSGWPAWAQPEPAKPLPPLRTIRYEENWSGFQARPGQFESIKNVELAPRLTLSLGADVRQRFELFRNEEWGLEKPGVDGFHLQRYMLHAELRAGSGFRLFTQLKSNFVTGREDAARPTDRDRLDVHQAFAEFRMEERGELTVRAGRQEVALGSSRLVSVRDGPNVRLSFDGARLAWKVAHWKVELLALRPVRTRVGAFDDSPDHRQSLWGVYATSKEKAYWGGTLDLYYLGLDRKRARFDSGVGREQRQSFGARYSKRTAELDLDYEGIVQVGTFLGRSIRAWTTGTNTGYTLTRTSLQPRFGLKANITSGDRHPDDGRHGTFNALFPKGNYFSQADVLGPYNLMDLHPGVSLRLHKEWVANFDCDLFWRYSTADGLYDVPGNPVVAGRGSNARFIGHAYKGGLEWKANRYLSVEAEYQRLFSGTFLRQQGRTNSIDFLAIWTTLRF